MEEEAQALREEASVLRRRLATARCEALRFRALAATADRLFRSSAVKSQWFGVVEREVR
jgi:hypothetical protein